MNIIPCASQNADTIILPADCCVFGRFGRLSPAACHSADCRFDSGVKWWIHVSSIVMYQRKNFDLLRVNMSKQLFESSIRCCFCSGVSKRGTYLENTFFIPKCSCIMVCTLPADIFRMSAISLTFTLRSDIMIFSVFSTFSGITASFGLPVDGMSSVSVRPRLNSAYQ